MNKIKQAPPGWYFYRKQTLQPYYQFKRWMKEYFHPRLVQRSRRVGELPLHEGFKRKVFGKPSAQKQGTQ